MLKAHSIGPRMITYLEEIGIQRLADLKGADPHQVAMRIDIALGRRHMNRLGVLEASAIRSPWQTTNDFSSRQIFTMAAVRDMKTANGRKESPAMTGKEKEAEVPLAVGTHQKGADLDDHLQDGAGADRQGERGPLRRVGEAADPDADDRRAAGEERRPTKAPERRPLLEDRRGDADAFGDVVQREAEHQEGAEPGRARREGGADRQPFAEIVQADAERDEGRQREARRRSAAAGRPPSAGGSSPTAASTTMTGPWKSAAARRQARALPRSVSTNRKASRPTVSASTKFMPPRPTPRSAG